MTAPVLKNMARMTVSGTPGTSTITLGSAVSSFLSFAGAGVADGSVVPYTIEDGANREKGYGTYTSAGTTLSRTTVTSSTNGGSKISATSAAQVFIDPDAANIVQKDSAGLIAGGIDVINFDTSVSGAPALNFDPNNNSTIGLSGTDLFFKANGVEIARVSQTGGLGVSRGVAFPATQFSSSDANTLDDYEEGTFTPTIVGTGTAGAGTYSVQSGRYIKIGALVWFDATLTWSGHTGTTGMKLGGLPFTNGAQAAPVSVWLSNQTFAATFVIAEVAASATEATLSTVATGAAAANLAMDTAATMHVAGCYSVV